MVHGPAKHIVGQVIDIVDPATGRLRYVNAGHNPPALVRADGRTETLTEGGMVLGLFDSVPYAAGSVQMNAGDVLVVYSDGVSETWDEAGDEFGDAREAGIDISAQRNNLESAIYPRCLEAAPR